MNRALIIMTAMGAAAGFVGCGSGTEEENPVVWDSSGKPLSYTNGHPLSLPTEDSSVLALESDLMKLVNAHRVSKGLNALVDLGSVRDVARAHSSHMIAHGFFSHMSPEGYSPGDRLTATGISWSEAGENIAAFATAQAVFDAWMASPGHRQNIESEQWTHAGVGYAFDAAPTAESPDAHYWTHNFLKP